MVSLLDSHLSGGSSQHSAIYSEGGLYCLRVKTDGYGKAIEKRHQLKRKPLTWEGSSIVGPDIDEYIGDKLVKGHGKTDGALKLPIMKTPAPALPPVKEWVDVAKFAKDLSKPDWSEALEEAIESGAELIYFPRGHKYEFTKPVRVAGKVQRLVGFGSVLSWKESVWKRRKREQTDLENAPPPLFIFEGEQTLVLDRLGSQHIQHNSQGTLVLRSCSVSRYTTGKSGGKLFAEDIKGSDWHFDHPQNVWVRQWNPESHQAGPCVHQKGGTLWAMGFKTEYESQKFLSEGNAQTEILGSFIYPIGKIPPERPIFEARNSAMSLIYGTSVYRSNHKVHILDTAGNKTLRIGNDSLKWSGSRARMDLYTSDGGQK